jgi:site-specific recombinase XerD
MALTAAYLDPCAAVDGRHAFKVVRAALHHHTTVAQLYGQSCPKEALTDPISQEVAQYAEHLKRVAGFASATVTSHRRVLDSFLRAVVRPPLVPQTAWFTAKTVATYLTTAWRHLKPSSKKRGIGIIRGYVRYLAFQGIPTDPGLLQLPLTAPVWKLDAVPRRLADEDLERLMRAYDGGTSAGCRDYAIALCFIDLGLRVSEVADLTVDDWDWHHGVVRIHGRKTRHERLLPVPVRLGEAVVRYLTESRPQSGDRTLFVRFAHMCGEPMGPGQIRGTIRRAYARAGIPPQVTGTHVLRHTTAATLYNAGADLKIIADILGHTSIDTTVVYTKVPGPVLAAASGRWPTAPDPSVLS